MTCEESTKAGDLRRMAPSPETINARSGSRRKGELCVLPVKVMKKEGATVRNMKSGNRDGVEKVVDIGPWRGFVAGMV